VQAMGKAKTQIEPQSMAFGLIERLDYSISSRLIWFALVRMLSDAHHHELDDNYPSLSITIWIENQFFFFISR